MSSHEVTLAAVVEATVSHTAPCVPECTVCHPTNTTEGSED